MARYDSITLAAIDCAARLNGRYASVNRLRDAIEAKYPGAVDRAMARNKREAFDRKFQGKVPTWVKTFVQKYAEGHGVQSVRIRQSRTQYSSSGYCDGSNIVVTLGTDEKYGVEEKKVVVLHEIAHAIVPWDRHGERFYDEWYKMLLSENLYRWTLSTPRYFAVNPLKAAARRARAKRQPLTKAS